MTYKEAEDKIIQAYFRDEIKPMDPSFCFCGTLNDRNCGWCDIRQDFKGKYYSFEQYGALEYALLSSLRNFGIRHFSQSREPGMWVGEIQAYKEGYEDALFAGMSDALDALKQIHIDRGENIDPVPFNKRELAR